MTCSSAPPSATDTDRRHAFFVIVVLVVACAATAPVARWPMRAVPQFVPIYDTAIVVLDTIAGVLFYGPFASSRRRSMLVLACAYVFTPLIVAAHALSVPSAFIQGTVIGGEQTAAWSGSCGTRSFRCSSRPTPSGLRPRLPVWPRFPLHRSEGCLLSSVRS
jgi:hypothetical protein